MEKNDVIFDKKEFLNLPGQEELAAILVSIRKQNWNNEPDSLYRNVSYNLVISDCNKQVYLDIDDDSEFNQENSLFKIDTLIDTLSQYRAALVVEFKIQNDLRTKRKAKEEKEKAEAEANNKEVTESKDKVNELTIN